MAKTTRIGTNRGMMERMHRMHQLLRSEEYPNCTQLAKEFGVAKRTIKRDVEFMKDRLKLPVGFDPRNNGYFYSSPVESFPDLPMTEAEVFGLFVASKAIEQYRGTPFARASEHGVSQNHGAAG